MIINNLKIVFRNLAKRKGNSLISILGLAVGLAAFILMGLYIQYENSWDSFQENFDQIYRVEQEEQHSQNSERLPRTPYPLGPELAADFPEILKVCRLGPIWETTLAVSMDKKFIEKGTAQGMTGFYTDNSIFDIFTFRFIAGSAERALTEPYSMVLTQAMAEKYFPGQEAVGKSLRVDGRYRCNITGVIKNIPANSHFKPKFFISLSTLEAVYPGRNMLNDWGSSDSFNYLLLAKNTDTAALEAKIGGVLNEHLVGVKKSRLYLSHISGLHFSTLRFDLADITNVAVIYLFGVVALFILCVACINFMNLTTAYSFTRAKEIGIRKTMGATRLVMIRQFVGESVLISLLSMVIAFAAAEFFLPVFNGIVDRQLELKLFADWPFSVTILLVTLAAGVLAGLYPALVLSSFKPVMVLKGVPKLGNKKAVFSKAMVLFQFFISIVLTTGAITVYRQLNYLKGKDLGYDIDNLMVFRLVRPDQELILRKLETLKNEISGSPYVLNASISEHAFFNSDSWFDIRPQGVPEEEAVKVAYNIIDYDFVDTFGLTLKEGRGFSRSFPSDGANSCLINETALRIFGWDSIDGKAIYRGGRRFSVIGVLEDYHINSLYWEVPPHVMFLHGGVMVGDESITIRIVPGKRVEAGKYLAGCLGRYFPGEVVELRYLADSYDQGYWDVLDGVGRTFGFFSFLSIFIASVGLFALVSFSTSRRAKELGVRKVLGATVLELFGVLVRPFGGLIVLAVFLAWPVSYFLLDSFLSVMVYRVGFSVWVFLLSGLVAFLGLMVAVSYKSYRAACANPVMSLRYE